MNDENVQQEHQSSEIEAPAKQASKTSLKWLVARLLCIPVLAFLVYHGILWGVDLTTKARPKTTVPSNVESPSREEPDETLGMGG
jgi:hypothetical protein